MTNKKQDNTRNIKISVKRSNKNVSALIFDLKLKKTLATFSSNSAKGSKNDKSISIGNQVASFLKSKKISSAIFDRNNYRYHGRVKQIAESIRQNGITI
jgi:large subunit ribosomal protein L18